MITYRGDKFLKSKKFKLDEQVVTFIAKTNKGYVFESSGNKITLPEDKARKLEEINNVKKI